MKATLKRSILVICCLLIMMFSMLAANGALAAADAASGKSEIVSAEKAKKIKPKKLKLNKTKLSLYHFGSGSGQMEKLKVSSVTPSNASKDVIWSSSNKKVAKVASNGSVTAVGKGTCTITAKSKYNSKIKATCKVTVTSITAKNFYKKKVLPKMDDIFDILEMKPEGIKTNISKLTKSADNLVAFCKMHPKLKGTALTYAKSIQSYVDTIESRCKRDYLKDDSTMKNAVKNANNKLKKLKSYCNNKF